MAGLAEFERDLIRDRVKSGLAAAGVKLGRRPGQRPSDKKAKRVLDIVANRHVGRHVWDLTFGARRLGRLPGPTGFPFKSQYTQSDGLYALPRLIATTLTSTVALGVIFQGIEQGRRP